MRLTALLSNAVVVLLPNGGQRTARRNAQAALLDTTERTRARREAEAELAALLASGVRIPEQPRATREPRRV